MINAKWVEVDFEKKLWTIPAERMKMGKSHIVPLADQAIEILKEQKILADKWPHIFPSAVRKRNSISNNTILQAIKRLGYKGRMTGHGFRSLGMTTTLMEELGYPFEIPDAQLSHSKGNNTRKAYDRTEYLPQRKKMMQDWADYIDGVSG